MTPIDKRYMSVEEVAEYTTFSPHTLNQWRSEGAGPSFLKIGRKVVYVKSQIDEFMNSSTQGGSDAN